jgi:hypothetical protein
MFLILSSLLRAGPPISLLPSGFPTKTILAHLSLALAIRAT